MAAPKSPPPDGDQGSFSPAPVSYGIRAVAQMTGIDEHTLRIWERRYGFPRPSRSGAGTRQFSSEDVHKLRLVSEALRLGHRPGEVVAQPVSQLEALLALARNEGGPGSQHEQHEQDDKDGPPETAGPDTLDDLVSALKREDLASLRAGLRDLGLLLGPRRFVTEVAHPLAVQVGELWEAGTLEVHQEHLMSDCLSTQLRLLRSLFDDLRGPVVLLATLPDEPHGLGLEMVALYLATTGVAPRVIGVSTPAEQIVRAARAHGAAAVGISVMPSSNLGVATAALRAMVQQLPPGTRLWVGGAGAKELRPLPGVSVVTSFAALDAARTTLS